MLGSGHFHQVSRFAISLFFLQVFGFSTDSTAQRTRSRVFFQGARSRRVTSLRHAKVQCFLWAHGFLSDKVLPSPIQPVLITSTHFDTSPPGPFGRNVYSPYCNTIVRSDRLHINRHNSLFGFRIRKRVAAGSLDYRTSTSI